MNNNAYKVKVTRQAMEQLQEIVHYISKELLAPEAADHLLMEIRKGIESLSEFPERHAFIEEEPWRSEGVRKIVVKNFLVYYWVDMERCMVYITAVIYNKRDQIYQLRKMNLKQDNEN